MAPIKPAPGRRRSPVEWHDERSGDRVRVVVTCELAGHADSFGFAVECLATDAMGEMSWQPVADPAERQRLLAAAALVAWARAQWEREDESVDDIYRRSGS